MKVLKRIIQAILLVIMVAIIGGLIFLNHIKKKAIPDYNATVDIENLKDEVVVIRDSLAIPHIYAQNEEDLYRVVGYLSAQDRLWQMDLMRRITTGRLSEIFGADMLTADQMFRSFEFSKKSRGVIQQTDPEIMKCVEAYADGVNQFINTHSKKLSFEFSLLGYKPEPWTPIHTFNLIGYMAWDLASGWDADMAIYKISQLVSDSLLTELFPDPEYQRSFIYPDYIKEHPELVQNTMLDEAVKAVEELGAQVFQASNNWAVAGEKSETGLPLVANDMHLGFMSPGIWYQMHQVVEGQLNVTGVVLPGQPYVIAGHNEDIAWGMTNITVDNLDFYMETLNPEDTNQYKLNGRWVDMKIIEETINVKDAEPVTRINRYTHRGPVVSSFKGVKDKTMTAKWIGTDFSNELRTVHLFNRASNWEEFRDAASTFIAVSQNIVYGDKEGNIGLQAAGGLPIREGDHIMVYPGDTTQYDWTGIVPFENMPYTYNPECGYVASANNKTVDENYPHYIGSWFSVPNRYDRVVEMLTAKEKFSIKDFQDMHSDQLSVFARKLTPVFLEALSGNYEGIEAQAIELLREWDYHMDMELAAPLIYEQMFIQLIQALYADELGQDTFEQLLASNIIARHHIYKLFETRSSGWLDDVTTGDHVETLEDNINTAFSAAIDTISTRIGGDIEAWKWGDVHTITIEHPMGGVDLVAKLFNPNLGPYRTGGSFHTVAPYSYPLNSGGYNVNHGASERHVFSAANWDQSKTVIPTGTSGIPASPYYGNQTDLYMDFKYHDDPFTKEEVEKVMKYKAVFQ